MNTTHLSKSEQRVIETLRRMYKERRGKPFSITISHSGGSAPIQVYKSVPVRQGIQGESNKR